MSVSAVIDGEAFRVNEGMGPEVSGRNETRLADALPQAPWDFPLYGLRQPVTERTKRAASVGTPLVPYGRRRGAPVASQQSRILHGGTASLTFRAAGGHNATNPGGAGAKPLQGI